MSGADPERVARLLDRLLSDIATLKSDGAAVQSDVDPIALRAAKYSLVIVVEGASRIAQHLVVGAGWPIAEGNADAFRRLAAEGVIPAELGERLASAVGLRNLLVHRYDDIDDGRVAASLSAIDDFTEFAALVAHWISEHE